MAFERLRKIDAAIMRAGEKATDAAGRVGKRSASTSENYCNPCGKMADNCKCKKPCCVNLRHGFDEGGTHHKTN